VVTCANGTDALQLALMAIGIGKGDAVFCPTFTFFASAEAIAAVGATPIFVDSDELTFNICATDLERRIKKVQSDKQLNLKAVITVDLFGLPANYPVLEPLCKKYGLKLIEDAAQGFGGTINGRVAGSFGDIATTSFFPAKPLGCYGDGGAVFTNDDEIAAVIKSLRVHGKGNDKYDNVRIGMNSRLDTIQAAILLAKLDAFPEELTARNMVAVSYEQELSSKYITPYVPEGFTSSWAQYTLRDKNRDAAIAEYQSRGIPTMIYYRTCLHEQTAFAYLNIQDETFPVAKLLSQEVFSLPMHAYLKSPRDK
jgi:dTDP-4-amino-4,6-dideoxygalactose transaminase